ncbi:MAG: hypothetical protein A3K67_02000 [Euryarchaeota archaeon RBG_16_62_10]|nr:MAG: hypothetical protein A3K67_02000 [Euryarchaeota archaeon RBG_16_62_10]
METWLPMYGRICEEFGFSEAKDLECARLLAGILGGRCSDCIEHLRRGFPDSVLVCGSAPSLPDELSQLSGNEYIVAADGATTSIADAGLEAAVIVTDLDGIVEDQLAMNAGGTAVFVHAHGDNQRAIHRYADKFSGPVVGTCQCPPPPGLSNFGGFTDGDRAACICAELGARRIFLAGFDFDAPADKAGRSREVKRRKLVWARAVLDELSREGVQVMRVADRPAGP